MSLDLILLGALRTPASGYDLKRWFEAEFRHVWCAEPSQIYRTLATLEAHGLLSVREEASPKGPARRVYATTARGRGAVEAWLKRGPAIGDERLSHVAQIGLLSELPDTASRVDYLLKLRALVYAQREELRAKVARGGVGPVVNDDAREAKAGDVPFFRDLTVDLGIHQATAMLAWIDRTIAKVQALA